VIASEALGDGLQERRARFEVFQHRADLLAARPKPIEDPGGNRHELPADVHLRTPFLIGIPASGSDNTDRGCLTLAGLHACFAAPTPEVLSQPRLDSGRRGSLDGRV